MAGNCKVFIFNDVADPEAYFFSAFTLLICLLIVEEERKLLGFLQVFVSYVRTLRNAKLAITSVVSAS